MTTAPIHSVKHVKATYHRYQILALISAGATILAVLLAALFSFQLSRVSKNVQQSADNKISATHQTLDNQVTLLNQKIKALEEKSAQDKETIQKLEIKTVDLNKKLEEARKAAEAKAITPTPTGVQQTQPQAESNSPPRTDQTGQPAIQNPTTGKTETTAPPLKPPASTKPASETTPSPPSAQGSSSTQ